MAKSHKLLTEEEIRKAIEESNSSENEYEEFGESDDENENLEFSDSEEDILETESVAEEEQVFSEDEETTDEENEVESEIYIGKDKTEWKSVPNSIGRIRSHNIIRGNINKVKLPPGQHIDSCVDAFSLLFSDEVINIIVKYTNLHGRNIQNDKWKLTDSIEIRAFIGILITVGITKQGIIDYNELWNPLFGNPICRSAMSRDRFVAILRHLRFDDSSTRSIRRSRDKFAPIRDVWDLINKNLLKHYIPGENLTIDEQLIPFRGRVAFRQYIPSKPDKYGMKVFWICDSNTSYPLSGIPYLGQEGPERGKNLAQKIVIQLCEPFERSNRNITFDNFFTRYELVENLLSKGLTCIGTLRKNKACIPKLFLPHKNREVESSIFGFRKNMTLVSYVPKKTVQ